MRVTIIGAGNMGRGIGTRAVAGGHEVEIVDHDPAEASALTDELSGAATATDKDLVGGEIVVLAMHYPATLAAAQEYETSSQARSSSTSRIRSTSRRWTGWPSRRTRPRPRGSRRPFHRERRS